MEDSVKQRLIIAIKHKGYSQNRFEKACGLSNGYINNISKGIGADKLQRILSKFPDLNPNWLLTGEGEMLLPEETHAISIHQHKHDADVPRVPLLNLDVRGGFDSNTEWGREYIERLIPWPGARRDDIAIEVSGQSMSPTIPPGSFVLLRHIEAWREYLELDQLYVLVLNDDRRLLKHVRRSERGRQYLLLHSYNPSTPDQDIPISLISRVFKVVGQITKYGY